MRRGGGWMGGYEIRRGGKVKNEKKKEVRNETERAESPLLIHPRHFSEDAHWSEEVHCEERAGMTPFTAPRWHRRVYKEP